MAEVKAEATPAADLKTQFLNFCRFGNKDNPGEMDGATFSKLSKECGLINKSCTKTDIDLIFTKAKPKGGRKLNYGNFLAALDLIAVKRYPKTFKEKGQSAATQMVIDAIVKGGGPKASGTKAAPTRFHDDKSTYTGAYKSGGPSTTDDRITLSSLMDRSSSDARGVQMGRG